MKFLIEKKKDVKDSLILRLNFPAFFCSHNDSVANSKAFRLDCVKISSDGFF